MLNIKDSQRELEKKGRMKNAANEKMWIIIFPTIKIENSLRQLIPVDFNFCKFINWEIAKSIDEFAKNSLRQLIPFIIERKHYACCWYHSSYGSYGSDDTFGLTTILCYI